MTTKELEIFAIIDSDGDYAVGADRDEAAERYENNVGDIDDTDGFRIVRLVVQVPVPEVVTLSGEVSVVAEPVLTEAK